MLDWNEARLLYKVSKLYYEADYTQGEIAKDLSIHRTTVGRMLKKARKVGIVKIEVQSNFNEQSKLEEKLVEHFGMKEVIIIPNAEFETDNDKLAAMRQASYKLLDRIVVDGDVLGITWGRTIGKIINNQFELTEKKVDCVPLVGGPGEMNVDYHVNGIVYRLAQAFNSSPYLIDAAAVYDSETTAQEVLNSKFMRKIHELWEELTVAIVGIGSPEISSNMVWSGFLGELDKNEITDIQAIGEICSRFYTKEGKIVESSISDRTIAVNLEKLKNIRYSIGIAYSKRKAKSIIGAMEGKMINTLITDEETAKEIIRLTEI